MFWKGCCQVSCLESIYRHWRFSEIAATGYFVGVGDSENWSKPHSLSRFFKLFLYGIVALFSLGRFCPFWCHVFAAPFCLWTSFASTPHESRGRTLDQQDGSYLRREHSDEWRQTSQVKYRRQQVHVTQLHPWWGQHNFADLEQRVVFYACICQVPKTTSCLFCFYSRTYSAFW